MNARGGRGSPLWGFLCWRGRPEGGIQGGEPRRGRRGTPFADTAQSRPGGRGVTSEMTATWRAARPLPCPACATRVTARSASTQARGHGPGRAVLEVAVSLHGEGRDRSGARGRETTRRRTGARRARSARDDARRATGRPGAASRDGASLLLIGATRRRSAGPRDGAEPWRPAEAPATGNAPPPTPRARGRRPKPEFATSADRKPSAPEPAVSRDDRDRGTALAVNRSDPASAVTRARTCYPSRRDAVPGRPTPPSAACMA